MLEVRLNPTPEFVELVQRLEAAVAALERLSGTGPLKGGGSRLAYSVKEVAELTGLSRNEIYRLLRTGELRSIRLGHRFLIPRSVLEEWLRSPAKAR
ncbi:helix-turn-helix domain-containing protein [Calidithermus timidus]|uniref:helix-turn-helix domain-containing protein n=1 Tax=Calidithermus timidus TaxID=307124 RepID=UPI00035F6AF9|nr:helix-turn-helix domain-containing protein [Calidithermus timidus]